MNPGPEASLPNLTAIAIVEHSVTNNLLSFRHLEIRDEAPVKSYRHVRKFYIVLVTFRNQEIYKN